MIRVRLTAAQADAVSCRDWSDDPTMLRALQGDALIFAPGERDTLFTEIVDASNAEDAHAWVMRRRGHLDCARKAERAAKTLGALAGRVLKAS